MALFNLTDYSYRAAEPGRAFVPLTKKVSSDSTQNRYYQNMMRYPIDLGDTDRGHYMVIHINVQEKSIYKADFIGEGSDGLSTIQRNRIGLKNQTGATNIGGFGALTGDNLTRFGTFVGQNIPESVQQGLGVVKEKFSAAVGDVVARGNSSAPLTTQALQRSLDVAFGVGGGITNQTKESLGRLNDVNFLRTTRRTTETIALYMPGTMAYGFNQQFNELSMGGEPAAFYGSGMSLITDAVNNQISAEQLGRNLTPFIAEKIKNLSSPIVGTNSATGLFASLIGGVQNPRLEIIYSSPKPRNFSFEFMFYPSSETEAVDIQNIIQSLQFHQAPEIMRGTAGYFLVPPSEFDIEFHYNGQINPNIPPISTCVLTSMTMDYAPKGFVAYETPGQNIPKVGGTGMPFAIRLTLNFMETEIMTKYNFSHGINEFGKINQSLDETGTPFVR